MEVTFQIPRLTKTPYFDRLETEQTLLVKAHAHKQLPSFCSVFKPGDSKSSHLISCFSEGEEGDDYNSISQNAIG